MISDWSAKVIIEWWMLSICWRAAKQKNEIMQEHRWIIIIKMSLIAFLDLQRQMGYINSDGSFSMFRDYLTYTPSTWLVAICMYSQHLVFVIVCTKPKFILLLFTNKHCIAWNLRCFLLLSLAWLTIIIMNFDCFIVLCVYLHVIG